jgi:hypothetical protein
MTRPDDIPQDVWDAARHALFGSISADAFAVLPFKDVVHMGRCARAILAAKAEQREADAKLADAEFRNLFNDSGRHIAGRIAAAIRKGAA